MQNTGSDGGLTGLLGKNTRLGDRADVAEQVGSWWGRLGESSWHWNTAEKQRTS